MFPVLADRAGFLSLEKLHWKEVAPTKESHFGLFSKDFLKRVFLDCVDGAGPAEASTPGLGSPI